MKDLKEYSIKFSGLKLGDHSFDYQLNDEFFKLFDYSEFTDSRVRANVKMFKKETGLDLKIFIEGVVSVPCDVTNEPFDLPIKGETQILVRFGDEYNDNNEEILIIPHGEHQINVAQFLYETTALAVPLKRVCPEVLSGKRGKEILKKLEGLENEKENEIDPRWDKLKDLLN